MVFFYARPIIPRCSHNAVVSRFVTMNAAVLGADRKSLGQMKIAHLPEAGCAGGMRIDPIKEDDECVLPLK